MDVFTIRLVIVSLAVVCFTCITYMAILSGLERPIPGALEDIALVTGGSMVGILVQTRQRNQDPTGSND